ncbi:MAG: hypothetical protein PHI11_12970 [Gallionella sp.]|nr:hypothetical protein [Gallionella sp.]
MSLKTAASIAGFALNPTGFLIGKIAEYAWDSIAEKDTKNTDLIELQLTARKQEIQMQMLEAQAKVAQELAIAKRIEMAEEVEIEEFYDLSGEGNTGLNVKESSVSVGVSASGHRVTKRIYKFRGLNSTIDATMPIRLVHPFYR